MIKQFYFKQFNLTQVKVKWFQVLLNIPNYSIKHQLFIYTQFKDRTILFQTILFIMCLHAKCSIWTIDRILSGATTPSQSWPGSDGNEGLLHILQTSKNCILTIKVICWTLVKGRSYLSAVSVFNRPSRLGYSLIRNICKYMYM